MTTYTITVCRRQPDGTFTEDEDLTPATPFDDHEPANYAAMDIADALDDVTDTPFTRHGDIWRIHDGGGQLVAYVQIIAADDTNWVTIPDAVAAWRGQYSESGILAAVERNQLVHRIDDDGDYLVRRPDIGVMLA